ncbi:MAG: hypothetical protein HDR52_08150 [Treponema sp.]|nr:hypothetical protein [Treponema sp.]
MKKELCLLCIILSACVCVLLSCVAMRVENLVYSLFPDEQFSDGIDGGGDMEYGFYFRNEADKEVESFSVCLSIFDEDGESVFYSDYISVDFEADIEPEGERHFSIDVSDFFEAESDRLYTVDFIYASSIKYKDGSQWEDFLGVYATRL